VIDYSLQLFYYFNLSSGLCTECEALLSRLQPPHFCGRHEIRTPRCLLSATPPPPGLGVSRARPTPAAPRRASQPGRQVAAKRRVAARPSCGLPGRGRPSPGHGPGPAAEGLCPGRECPLLGSRAGGELPRGPKKKVARSVTDKAADGLFAFNPCKYHHLFWRKKPPPVLLRAKLKVKNADCLIVVVSSGLSLCPFCEMRR